MKAIVGFEISIERFETKKKLSQNRSEEDQKRVQEQLRKSSSELGRGVAAWMQREPRQNRRGSD